MALIWAVLSIIVFLYILLQTFLAQTNCKRMPPGPKGLPILGHLHLLGNNPDKDLCNLARKHGPIMGLRLGFMPAVVISSPAAAKLVLKTHDLVFASKPRHEAARYISYDQRNLVSSPYGSYWRNMRKLCTVNLLSSSVINQFQDMRRAEIRLFVDSLKGAAEMRKTVDLSARVSAMIGDMNCLMVFGRKYSDLEEGWFKDAIMETMEVSAKFNLADYFPCIGWLDVQGLNRRMKRLGKLFDGFLEKIIDDHVNNKQSYAFVNTIMAIMESGEAGFDFDRRHVKAVLLDLLIAGMDTSSITIEWAMAELMRHPEVTQKLQQELESLVGLDKMVEESHLDKLEYLECVVKEAMRLHPVVPLVIRESTGDCVVEGYHIAKSSRVVLNLWAIARDPSVWADPESFRPERFIGSNIDLKGQHFELLPFSSGRRRCPGMQLGLKVVKMVVAQLLHCFHWEVPAGDVDMSEHFGMITSRANNLMAIPRFRLHN